MNRKGMADELDQQLELLLRGRREAGAESEPLLALASELRMLANPEFKNRLKEELIGGYELPAESARFYPARASAFAGIVPMFSAKRTGLLPADHRSFLVSFASHAALIALIASGIFVTRAPRLRPSSLISELSYPLAGNGGGGSGDGSAMHATRGTPPKFSDEQVTPPAIVVKNEPKLPGVEPTTASTRTGGGTGTDVIRTDTDVDGDALTSQPPA